MAYVGILWIIGIICIVGAAVGKEISVGDTFKLPAATELKVRGVVAVVGVISLAAGGALFAYPNGLTQQHSQQSAQAAAAGQSTIAPSSDSLAPHQDLPTSEPPAASSPVTASASPSLAGSSKSTSGKPLYLSSLTGTTDGSLDQVAPDSGPQTLGSETYPHSLSYSLNALCYSTQSITYAFSGKYHYLMAEVGVSPSPGGSDGSIGFEVDNSSGVQLGIVSAKYGSPGNLRVNIEGQTSLTLKTSGNGCPGGNDAVWGDAELLP